MRRLNHSRRGLLSGPREGGCWAFLLAQAFLCTLVTGALASITESSVLKTLAEMFLGEAVSITLLLLSLAQSSWVEERWPRIPNACYQLPGWLLVASVLSLVVGNLTGQAWIVHWAIAYVLGMLALLLLSLPLRIVLSLWDRARGK